MKDEVHAIATRLEDYVRPLIAELEANPPSKRAFWRDIAERRVPFVEPVVEPGSNGVVIS